MSEAWIIWEGEMPIGVRPNELAAREFANGYLRGYNGTECVHIQGPIAAPVFPATIPPAYFGAWHDAILKVGGRVLNNPPIFRSETDL